MRIVTPLSNIHSYEVLSEAGADEFFCGFLPYAWLEKYTSVLPINRRENLGQACNITTLSEMKILYRMQSQYHKRVKVAFNAHYYIEEQYPLLKEIILRLLDIGFDTFILADYAFMLYLREQGIDCKFHCSGEMELVNSQALKWISPLEISRFVFPRKISIDSMESCIGQVNNPNMEYEAFVLNALCPFSGGMCNSVHCDEIMPSCYIPHQLSQIQSNTLSRFSQIQKRVDMQKGLRTIASENCSETNTISGNGEYAYAFGEEGCGVCKIKKMKNIGITHVKVVGRGYDLQTMIRDIRAVKEIIQFADEISDCTVFEHMVKEKFFGGQCPAYCYYQ